ncbi:DUF1398 domain-containing protein [Methyloferula stellata]|uniref:DUF1398 domain-containing protein n=1 Tax=Methyloferula stellata TaxID=876270 RepID=UPI000374D946|nr:DUF1398 family protein [Methyloferula stellata]
MDPDVKDVMEDCTRGSDEGRLSFPQVVLKLMEAGVEQYHADLRRAEKTYYMPDGASHVVACPALEASPAQDFSASGVEAAIRAIQTRAITYKEFCERIGAAGCVGYFVSLAGRRAVYFGRTSEMHIEPFPHVQ